MISAIGVVILPQNPCTENGHVPGWSCIISVVSLIDGRGPGVWPLTGGVLPGAARRARAGLQPGIVNTADGLAP